MNNFWILSALLCSVELIGQNPSPYFSNLGTEEGLASPEVHCIFQDHNGLMWFGTDNGLSSFDGYSIRTFDAEDGLFDNVVLNIFEDIQFITNYLELEKMRFSPKFSYEIKVADDINANNIAISPMLVLPFVENAVVHGISQSEQGKINISYAIQDKELLVIVTDNGPGITESKADKQKSQSTHRSVGITITKKPLELIHQQQKNQINIEDIQDDHGQVLGTKVTLRIKFTPL